MVVQLLATHQVGQHQAASLHPVQTFDRLGHLLDQLGVKCTLPLAHPAIGSEFFFVWQIRDDSFVGFQTSEYVRLDQTAKERVAVLLACLKSFDKCIEPS